ncbi:hypothetical protein ACFS07_19025 [Undibacterium arcticum]
MNAAVDAVAKNAPAGSESAVGILKSVVANANTGYEQLSTSVKQNAEKKSKPMSPRPPTNSPKPPKKSSEYFLKEINIGSMSQM